MRRCAVPKLSLSNAWDETRARFPRDGKLYAAVALAFLVLPGTVFGTIAPGALMGEQPDGAIGALMLVVLLLGLVGRLAIATLALRPSSVGEAISHALRRTPAVAVAFILFFLPVAVLLSPFLPAVLQSPESPPSGPLLAATAVLVLAFVMGVRLLMLVIPANSAESIGPVALLKRSWLLSSGNWWRLAIFFLIFFVGSMVAARAIGFTVGGALILLVGPLQPMSLSALVLAIVLSVVGAGFTTTFIVMLARIYAQLRAPHATVPEVSREG
jgi:hypothetical protein